MHPSVGACSVDSPHRHRPQRIVFRGDQTSSHPGGKLATACRSVSTGCSGFGLGAGKGGGPVTEDDDALRAESLEVEKTVFFFFSRRLSKVIQLQVVSKQQGVHWIWIYGFCLGLWHFFLLKCFGTHSRLSTIFSPTSSTSIGPWPVCNKRT